ncbi:hypothetical protein [Sphingomonas bisphenolicum]
MISRIAYCLIFAMLAGSCSPSFPEPSAQDPSPILGCYVAPDAPWFVIDASTVKFAGDGKGVSYRYELPKVGTVLRVPMDAAIVDGRLIFTPSEDRFYRVLHTSAGPVVRVAFGKEGLLRDYQHKSLDECTG